MNAWTLRLACNTTCFGCFRWLKHSINRCSFDIEQADLLSFSRAMQPKHVRWLDSYPKANKWMQKHGDVNKLLDDGKGIIKISQFLPLEVAEGIHSDLQGIPEAKWNATEAQDDYQQNNISHSFKSVRHLHCLERVVRTLSLLLPESLHSFSAAKYTKSDHIAPHDDRAYTQVQMDDGSIITCSRDIALIYYLTKGWKREYGGLLIDLEAQGGPQEYVPEFNTAILFRIPRWHQVTAMTTQTPRYTVFGWFLVPGKTYSLNNNPLPGTIYIEEVTRKKKKRKASMVNEQGSASILVSDKEQLQSNSLPGVVRQVEGDMNEGSALGNLAAGRSDQVDVHRVVKTKQRPKPGILQRMPTAMKSDIRKRKKMQGTLKKPIPAVALRVETAATKKKGIKHKHKAGTNVEG